MDGPSGAQRSVSREELIARYLPLIKKVARKVANRLPQSVELDDLVSSGVPGLIDAIDKYDPQKSTNFVSYAEIRIRGAILDELRSLDWVPRSVRQKLSRLEATYTTLEQRYGRNPSDEEVSEAMGLEVEEFNDLLGKVHPITVVSFEDLGLGTERDQRDFLQCVRDESDTDPQSKVRYNRIRKTLAEAIELLPEKHRVVISLYYYEDLNLKEIGKVLGVTESRVSQLHSQAVLMLRGNLKQALFH
ncbi:MAG: FliA/WhiG family RNA polymerase sigma factor [Deltaproteobacteria bacterium]|nr:FliA/WhiG family RNA polymerase sigma factor [Deltaproteobacteria bacterium]